MLQRAFIKTNHGDHVISLLIVTKWQLLWCYCDMNWHSFFEVFDAILQKAYKIYMSSITGYSKIFEKG